MGNKGLEAAAQRAWESKEYSDLIVTCKGFDFKVHKFVLCLQSDFFAKAVKENAFQEGQDGVVKMNEDDSTIVAAMLEFLYTSDYTAPHRNDRMDTVEAQTNGELITSDDQDKHPLLFHVDVYALADRIQNDNLKRTAEDNFQAVATTAWNDQEFPAAVQSVYDNSPLGSTGARLRHLATQIAAEHSRALFDKDQTFSHMMEGIPEFGRDLAEALSAVVDKNGMSLECPRSTCRSVFRADLDAPQYQHLIHLTCPVCSKKQLMVEWLS